MSLLSILIFAVAILALVSSALALIGSSKVDRPRMAWYFVAMLSGSVWAISIAVFLTLPETAVDIVPYVVAAIYLGGAMMTIGFACFGCWNYTIGKVIGISSIVCLIFLTVLVFNDHALAFKNLVLDARAGNSVEIVRGWCYALYCFMFAICFGASLLSVWQHARKARLKRVRQGDYILLAGWGTAGMIAGFFDVILPLFRYDLIWVGPIVFGFLAVFFYYVFLRFRLVSISASWMRAVSAIVLSMCGVILYMIIFYLIFTALFKIPNPSTSVLVLNFLMIVIVLLLIPVINEVKASINSLISVGQVDIAYVVKKLNKLAAKNVNLRELASFLADHLHFAYIGFVINGRLYSSKPLAMTADELNQISHMKVATGNDVWQEPNKAVQKLLDEMDLKAVAELRNAKGKTFGQLIVGKPLGKNGFERRDLIQLEMIINLVATVIDSEKHIRA